MFFGPLMWIVILAVIVGGVMLLLRSPRGAGAIDAPNAIERRTPLDILEERFARGEIDEKEFRDRKRALED